MARLTLKEAVLRLILMLAAVLVFTFLDWIMHSSFEYLAVPSWYFTNKVIYGTLFAFVSSLVFRRLRIPIQALLVSIITVGLLQIRYITYGYPLAFHLIVLFAHLVFLYASVFIALKALRRIVSYPR